MKKQKKDSPAEVNSKKEAHDESGMVEHNPIPVERPKDEKQVGVEKPIQEFMPRMRVFFPDESASCNPDEVKVGCIAKDGDEHVKNGNYHFGGVTFCVNSGK